MTVNKAILIGRLGRDPEMRTTNSGLAIANLRLATTERRKDRDGNWGEHTEWHTVACFGKTAENAGRFLTKGRQVYVEGRITTRKWQDKDGRDRYSTEVVANTLQFLGSKSDGASGGGGGGQRRAPAPAPAPKGQGGAFVDDDIPFAQCEVGGLA